MQDPFKMEQWNNGDVRKIGEFAKVHGIPDGAEQELIKITKSFSLVCNEFDALNDEQKVRSRHEFYEAQQVFFKTGSIIADCFGKMVGCEYSDSAMDDENPEQMNASMQTDEPVALNTVQSATGAVPKTLEIVRTIPIKPVDETVTWLPYVQFKKILQPVLELECGQLSPQTIGDMYHAVENAKRKVRLFDYNIATVEQAIMAIVHAKFDLVTKGIWEFQLCALEPTIEELQKFLEKRSLQIQEEMGPPTPVRTPTVDTGARRKQTVCIYCKNTTHTIYKCLNGFEGLSIPAKKQFLRREERCENCFMKHPGDICTAGSCWTCNLQHNSMLCPKNPKNN